MPPPERNLQRATPFKYLAALAALMVASAWLSTRDRAQRTTLESHQLPTALGESRVLTGGTESVPPEILGLPVAHYQGKPLFLQGRVAREMNATMMHRIGTTDAADLGVYQFVPKSGAPEDGWFLLAGYAPEKPGRVLVRPVGFVRRYLTPEELSSRSASPDAAESPEPETTSDP